MSERPRDGKKQKFTDACTEEIYRLVPSFPHDNFLKAADLYLTRATSTVWFKKLLAEAPPISARRLPTEVEWSRPWACTETVASGAGLCMREDSVYCGRGSPLFILHVLAHHLQPADTAWHGPEFVKLFLALVQNRHGVDVRRDVKKILLRFKIRTAVISPEAREKRRVAWHVRQADDVKADIRQTLAELEELRRNE